jgi:glyoxylase-like metal-dependent hydrolase (beta-lactamase superfamily II)
MSPDAHPPMEPPAPILLGPDVRCDVVSDGLFRLDGGSMFGLVPRVIWEKIAPTDARHRVLLGLNCLLIRTPAHTVLVDTGMGAKWDDKFAGIYDLAPRHGALVAALGALGVAPAAVTHVVHTHLHLDHTGAGTRFDDDPARPAGPGASPPPVVPTFPNARYVVQEGEWFAAIGPDPRSAPSYRADHFLPLRDAGQLDLIDGEREILPGISVRHTPGHTAYHQSILVQGGGRTLCFFGDILPTTCHLAPTWSMGFDLYPLEVLRQRSSLLEQAAAEGWIGVWEHDPHTPVSRVGWDGRRGHVLPLSGD